MEKQFSNLWRTICYDDQFASPQLEAFLKAPQSLLKHARCLKDDIKTSVYELKFSEKTFIVKRYNKKSFWYSLSHCFKKSRALNCWQAAHAFLKAGINTPTPVAMIEEKCFGIRHSAYYVYEKSDGDLLSEVLTDVKQTALCENVTIVLKKLLLAKISHGDMKATNWLVTAGNKITLIDLDAAKQHANGKSFMTARRKDEQRFLKNWRQHAELEAYFNDQLPALKV